MTVFSADFEPNSWDLHRRLGLERNASQDDIKRAYRKAAMIYHPDRAQGDSKTAEDNFKKVKEAYEVLTDPEMKAHYEGKEKTASSAFTDSFSTASGGQSNHVDTRKQSRESRRAELKEIAAKNPPIAEFVLRVIEYHYGLEETFFHIIPDSPHLLPSDRKLVDILLKTGHPILMRQVADSILAFSRLWKPAGGFEILENLIERNIPLINDYIANMFFYRDLINEDGARLFSRLLDFGYSESAVRSLSLGGTLERQVGPKVTWIEHPLGIELLLKAFRNANEFERRSLDARLFLNNDSDWADKLLTFEKYRSLSYLSVANIAAAGLPNPVRSLQLPFTDAPARMCKELFLKKSKGKAKKS